MNGFPRIVLGAWCAVPLAAGAAGVRAAQPPTDPSPVAEAVVHRSAGVVTLELTNGIPVHVKPIAGNGRVVVVVHILGAELMEDGVAGLTRAAGAAWQIDGEGKGVRLRAWPGMDGLTLRASAGPGDLSQIAERLRAALEAPKVSAESLERWVLRARGRQSARRGPERIVADTVAEALGAVASDQERAPTVEEAGDWLAWCVRSLPIEVSVAGDVAVGEVARTLAPVVAGLPARPADVVTDVAKRRAAAPAAREQPPISTREHASVPAGEAFVVLVLAGPAAGDLEGLRLGMIAAHAAGPRVAAALRAEEITPVHTSVICLPGRSRANSGAIIASARIKGDGAAAERARAIVQGVMNRIAAEGPTKEELGAAIGVLTKDGERRSGDPEYWATVLAGARFLGVNVDDLGGSGRTYAGATARSVGEALARMTAARPEVGVVLLPKPQERETPGGTPVSGESQGPESP